MPGQRTRPSFGHAQGASFGDLDLDGDLDLIVASGQIPIETIEESGGPVRVFVNDGLRFADTSRAAGLDDLASRNGRSVALADYDNDGDLDAVVTAIGQPVALLENVGRQGHWLAIDPGAPAPGLRVRVELSDGSVIVRTANAGGSWLSSEDPRVHIGLGDNEVADLVEVIYPDGTFERFEEVSADQVIYLVN